MVRRSNQTAGATGADGISARTASVRRRCIPRHVYPSLPEEKADGPVRAVPARADCVGAAALHPIAVVPPQAHLSARCTPDKASVQPHSAKRYGIMSCRKNGGETARYAGVACHCWLSHKIAYFQCTNAVIPSGAMHPVAIRRNQCHHFRWVGRGVGHAEGRQGAWAA